MGVVERYEEQKAAVERLRSERDRRKGAQESLMLRLKEEYGCKSVDAAEKHHAKLLKSKAELEAKLNKLLEQLEEAVDGAS